MVTNSNIPASIDQCWTESQKPKTTLHKLVANAQERLDEIKKLIAENPELVKIDHVDFAPTNIAMKVVRKALWNIFDATGKFIGRNWDAAIEADTRLLIGNLAKEERLPRYKRSDYVNIGNWLNREIDTVIDPDMSTASRSLVVYRHLDIDLLRCIHAILNKQSNIGTREWNRK